MFKDAERELRRLEAELLAQEEEEYYDEDEYEEDYGDEYEEDDGLLSEETLDGLLDDSPAIGSAYRNHANGYGQAKSVPVYNSDRLDRDPDDISREVLNTPRERGVAGLAVLAIVLALGILGVVLWWVGQYWGLF